MAVNIKRNTFNYIGNLAFYDGWHPNYVYFKSLLAAGVTYSDSERNRWRSDLAAQIAERAINDAQSHSTLVANSPDDSIDNFSAKFKTIIQFLHKAYDYERRNEILYFEQKAEDLENNFSKEELEKIAPLKEFYQIIKTAQGSTTPDFDYNKLISLINVLQSGLQNAAVTAEYESNRIKKIEDTIDHLIKSRMNQTKGLKRHYNNDTSKVLRAGIESGRRLKQKIFVEYVEHAQLTRQNKETKKYILFGGATFKKKIEKTVATTLAHWLNNVMAELIKDETVIQRIVQKIHEAYNNDSFTASSGSFFALEQEVREIIIQGVTKYAIDNLDTILNKELSQDIISEVKTAMVSDTGRAIFDTVQQYNIHGLNNSWGFKGDQIKLFENAVTTLDMKNNKATELFNQIQSLLSSIDSTKKEQEDKSFLIKAFKNENKLTRVQDLINLISRIEKIQAESEQLEKDYNKQQQQIQATIKTLTLSENNNMVPITISIQNGEVNVDMKSFLEALKADPVFQSMNFKTFNPQKIKTAISTLKGRASMELKDILINSIEHGVKSSEFSSTSEYIGTIRQELEQLEITIKGPSMAEMLTNIHFTSHGNSTYIDWTGSINGKNDQVTITIRHNKALNNLKATLASRLGEDAVKELVDSQQADIEKLQLQFMKRYQEIIDAEVKNLTRHDKKDKYSAMIPYMTPTVKSAIAYEEALKKDDEQSVKLQKIYNALDTAVQNLVETLKEQGVDKDKLIRIEQQLLNPFANSFQISNTVKSYDTYVNKIGFTGGSLGTNLDDQLFRINDIFTTAGMPISKEDMSWIRSAILNCFPGSIVEEKNKNLIEQYLGAVMAFALFDEGGAESAIISDYYKEFLSEVSANRSSAKILHLYYVNSIYVPGSYVLLKTINALENEVLPNLEKIPTIMKRGAGITIINPASESVIPNRPIFNNDSVDTQAWSTTGRAVASKVHLKILFLAGLLDIVNSINNTLGNIM